MNRPAADPWAREKMSRSDAQRRYNNLLAYQFRPMITNRRMSDDVRINVLKRVIREASRFRYESGVVAGSGIREEIMDLTEPYFKPDAPTSEELKSWLVRTIRAFGGGFETED